MGFSHPSGFRKRPYTVAPPLPRARGKIAPQTAWIQQQKGPPFPASLLFDPERENLT